MNPRGELKRRIRQRAHSLGIDVVGFAAARDFDELRGVLYQRKTEGRHASFEEQDIERRCSPQGLLPGAQTLISIAVAYPAPGTTPMPHDGVARGSVSSHSWGTDYHRVLADKLDDLGGFVACQAAELLPGEHPVRTRAMVDTGPLVDRAVAARAGLGFIGKNTCLITEEFGSWVFLGELLTTIQLLPDPVIKATCGDCTLCLTACPTGALAEPFKLEPSLCLAHVTQQAEPVTRDARSAVGGMLYGCDICQNVCPRNNAIRGYSEPSFTPDVDKAYPRLMPLFSMSNRGFLQQYGHMAGSWRRLKTWQRNALIIIGNRRDRRAAKLLIGLLDHRRSQFRALAAWALGRIGDQASERLLVARLHEEEDSVVSQELERAIEEINRARALESHDFESPDSHVNV